MLDLTSGHLTIQLREALKAGDFSSASESMHAISKNAYDSVEIYPFFKNLDKSAIKEVFRKFIAEGGEIAHFSDREFLIKKVGKTSPKLASELWSHLLKTTGRPLGELVQYCSGLRGLIHLLKHNEALQEKNFTYLFPMFSLPKSPPSQLEFAKSYINAVSPLLKKQIEKIPKPTCEQSEKLLQKIQSEKSYIQIKGSLEFVKKMNLLFAEILKTAVGYYLVDQIFDSYIPTDICEGPKSNCVPHTKQCAQIPHLPPADILKSCTINFNLPHDGTTFALHEGRFVSEKVQNDIVVIHELAHLYQFITGPGKKMDDIYIHGLTNNYEIFAIFWENIYRFSSDFPLRIFHKSNPLIPDPVPHRDF